MGIKPQAVVRIHRTLCRRADCTFVDTIDYSDPCVGCPDGHFGPYMRVGCPEQEWPVVQVTKDLVGVGRSVGGRPGDIFALVIFGLTGQRTAGCGICGARKTQMNAWGWFGCWHKRKIIITWLCEEASKRGHRIDDTSMLALFKAAIKEMRRTRGN